MGTFVFFFPLNRQTTIAYGRMAACKLSYLILYNDRGFYTYKYFMLLLYYACIVIGFVLYTQWETTIDCYYKEVHIFKFTIIYQEKSSREYLIIGNYISSIVMMISVFLLAL